MLELLSPYQLQCNPFHIKLLTHGIKGGWNYALDHTWLFDKITSYVDSHNVSVILDVGCGNSMFHPFLEQQLNMGIIGIDRIDGLCPHPGRTPIMDLCGDFLELSQKLRGVADIVFWLSSIEHNSIEDQKRCVQASLHTLKPGGLFLATFGYSRETHYYAPSEQTNLSAEDAQEVFQSQWLKPPDFESVVKEYRANYMDVDTRHRRRYGTSEYDFVVAGATIISGSVSCDSACSSPRFVGDAS